jgi:triosephosphate isomerase
MRRPLIAGNWKMHLTRTESVALASKLAQKLPFGGRADVAVCPPLVYLDAVRGAISDSPIALGAQNMYHKPSGAFTGEVSAAMLVDLGCRYVILGHSERRHILGETDELINQKVRAALAAHLTPIVCLGELLDQREAGQTMAVIQQQFDGSFAGLTEAEMERVVIAYEPVWAIGTGRVASPAQAEEVHLELRKLMGTERVRIQYGGSVKADNATDLLSQPNIDGALVGGASLVADEFLAIAAAI